MNLVVIGNGFDLAHGLPTKYSDFLDFMTLCIKKFYPNYINWGRHADSDDKTYQIDVCSITEILSSLQTDRNIPVENLLNNCDDEKLKNELMVNTPKSFIHNQFLRYFICIYAYKKQLTNNFNWIDIEDEIEKLLIPILKTYSPEIDREDILAVDVPIFVDNKHEREIFYFPELSKIIKTNKAIPNEKIKSEIFMLLFKELEQFDLLLKFYLSLIQNDFLTNGKKIFNINRNL